MNSYLFNLLVGVIIYNSDFFMLQKRVQGVSL